MKSQHNSSRPGRQIERLGLKWILLSGLALVPLIVDPFAQDSFRGPKEALFRGLAIVGLGLVILATLAVQIPVSRLLHKHRVALFVTLAIIAWTVVTAVFSTNAAISMVSLTTVIASCVLFICFLAVGEELRLKHLSAVIIPGVINAIMVLFEHFQIWVLVDRRILTDIRFAERSRLTGLLGNANDVGSYLLLSGLVAACVALNTTGARRLLASAAAGVMGLGIVVSQTLTAILAGTFALLILSILKFRRRTIVPVTLLFVAILAVIALSPVKDRMIRTVDFLMKRDFASVASGRALPFMAAAGMIRDHPFLGVGPGCFKYNFFEYKITIERRFPHLYRADANTVSYAEVHNDHLQVAAETGLTGYLLVLVSGWMLLRKRRSQVSNAESAFSATAAVVAPIAVAVLALAQFPLQLAATRLTLLAIGALCLSWSQE